MKKTYTTYYIENQYGSRWTVINAPDIVLARKWATEHFDRGNVAVVRRATDLEVNKYLVMFESVDFIDYGDI